MQKIFEMTTNRAFMFFVGLALVVVILILIVRSTVDIRSPNRNEPGQHAITMLEDHSINESGVSGNLKSSSVAPGSLKGADTAALLAEFEMTGNERFLQNAQNLFPSDLAVIISSVLWADSTNSEWLEKLEDLEPNNPLPNLVRASLYAQISDFESFYSEMEEALSKNDLNTGYDERQARNLEEMLRSGRLPYGAFEFTTNEHGVVFTGPGYGMDLPFSRHLGAISQAFLKGLDMEESSNVSLGLAWAERLRGVPGLDHSYRQMGISLELGILARFDAETEYGNSGVTVGDRRKALYNISSSTDANLHQAFRRFITDDNYKSPVKKQFFARLVVDGESAALNWLKNQQHSPTSILAR